MIEKNMNLTVKSDIGVNVSSADFRNGKLKAERRDPIIIAI